MEQSVENTFLCPKCKYSVFFRIVKGYSGNVDDDNYTSIPIDVEYTCKVDGDWDGKNCTKFKENKDV